MKKISSVALAAALAMMSKDALAQATPVSGLVSRLEVHVASQQLRFRVANSGGGGQYICGSSLEAYFPLAVPAAIGPYTYTQAVLDALRSSVYTARASFIEVDVYAVPNGDQCLVTDIVLK